MYPPIPTSRVPMGDRARNYACTSIKLPSPRNGMLTGVTDLFHTSTLSNVCGSLPGTSGFIPLQKVQSPVHWSLQNNTPHQSCHLPSPVAPSLPDLLILPCVPPVSLSILLWYTSAFDVSGAQAYSIQALLDSKHPCGRIHYLVDWEGYVPEE